MQLMSVLLKHHYFNKDPSPEPSNGWQLAAANSCNSTIYWYYALHRPHPRKETEKGAVVSMRRFLKEANIDANTLKVI